MRRLSRRSAGRILTGAFLVASPSIAVAVGGAQAAQASGATRTGATGQTRLISSSGTASFRSGSASGSATGGVATPELNGQAGDGAGVTDRSHSGGSKTSVGAVSQPKNVTTSTPGLVASFNGLDHYDQRFGAGPNQFSIEPPDQGLCVGSDGNGNTRVLEVVNDVLAVYGTSGHVVTPPTALNDFLGYAPAIVRSTHSYGPSVTDPSCLYDAQSQRWFLDVLTLDTDPNTGGLTGANHLDLAVSNTSDPTGAWTVYRTYVQDDGTDGTPNHGCTTDPNPAPYETNPAACLGDYPHLGSDNNGIYLTTNEYSLFGNNFIGAQVYAFSKAQLASGTTPVNMEQFNTHGMDTYGFALNGFTLWPSNTPGGGGDSSAGGTEYFLSSNTGAEAHDTGDGTATSKASNQLLEWALTNTSTLNSTPALTLSNTETNVGTYDVPPASVQKAGQTPFVDCLNSNPCALALIGAKDPNTEKLAHLDSNDSRMQQVTWVDGQLWGALDTALNVSNARQAGIEWFDVAASTSTGQLVSSLTNSGYVGLGNDNVTYPALAITSGGTGVMAFTVTGADYYPSAGYATVTPSGVSAVHVAAAGLGPDDGFTGTYALTGGSPRPRWGDYGAAVPVGSNVWVASEYIPQTCSFSQYKATSFTCGGTRTAYANWGTRISEVAAP